jgi:membrane protein DedA with SNARE-associated domain
MDVRIIAVVLLVAAIAGDAVNYSIGRFAGTRIIHRAKVHPRWGPWVNPVYVERAHEFFERHGGKAIVLGRFAPIIRTFSRARGAVRAVAAGSYAVMIADTTQGKERRVTRSRTSSALRSDL